jgi:hypothetical protein
MTYPKSMFSKISPAIVIIGLMPILFGPSTFSQAQTPKIPNRGSNKAIIFKPPKEGVPKSTNGAATRDGKTCLSDSTQNGKNTIPILPQNRYGLTLSARPEFLIYKATSPAKEILFSLQSEDDVQVYQAFLPLPTATGVVSIRMPNDAPELIENNKYRWTMAIICGKTLRPDSPTIGGWIQRIPKSPLLSAQLKTATLLDQVALYGENGIWYDMVSTLNKLQRTSPDNQVLSKVWNQLLKDNGMQEIEAPPLNK